MIWIVLFPVLMMMGCIHTKQPTESSPFEYREVHLPKLKSGEYVPLKLNNLDNDWGIWGHNLSAVLPEKHSSDVYAKGVHGVDRDQFCFTSDALFKYIQKYIRANYRGSKTIRFAILPNDNNVVCQCEKCIECGNTKSDASGAVYYMLDRLTSHSLIIYSSLLIIRLHAACRPVAWRIMPVFLSVPSGFRSALAIHQRRMSS